MSGGAEATPGDYEFNYLAFVKSVGDLVYQEGDGQVFRAWAIVQACIEVHVSVDRIAPETREQARASAWRDWYQAALGENASYTYWGLWHEFTHAADGCMGFGEVKATEAVQHAGSLADRPKPVAKSKAKRKTKTKETTTPYLRLVVTDD
jgi:hypothetical protein